MHSKSLFLLLFTFLFSSLALAETDLVETGEAKAGLAASGVVETGAAASGAVMPKQLRPLIEHARANHAITKVDRYSVQRAALEIDRVNAEFGPRIKARAGIGPITKATGDALSSTTDNSDFGVAYLGSIDLTVPIYAWGRKNALRTAAENGTKVAKLQAENTWNNSIYELKEAYFGLLFAKTLKDFIKENRETLNGIVEGFKDKNRDKKEIYQLEVVLSQVDVKMAEIEAAEKNAAMGLAYRSGFPLDARMDISDLWLSIRRREIASLEHYKNIFREHHPQFKLLRAGITAKDQLAKNEDRSRWPVLAFLAKYDYASTEKRDDQGSVFANDPYNRSDLVVGVGFEWDFQFSLHSVRRDQYLAEKLKLEAQSGQALLGMGALVEKAWNDLSAANISLGAARSGHKSAKKLWSRSAMSWSAGLGKSDDIQKAFTTRAFAAKDYYQAIYSYEKAWAALSRAVGREIDPQLVSDPLSDSASGEKDTGL